MTNTIAGRVSDLLLVRMHGRAAAYIAGAEITRTAIVEACRNEATVPDLASRILGRTIYAQSATRSAPLRELVQNALDASPRGGRVDVRTSDGGAVVTIVDRGRGMTRAELLGDLLVPFQSAKSGDLEAIGEHGIGFFSVLEVAPRIEVTTTTATDGSRLVIEPVGETSPYVDFTYRVAPIAVAPGALTGTTIRLSLARPITRGQLAVDLATSAGLVDPEVLRIYVDDTLVNTARSRLRRVASEPISSGTTDLGALELYIGTGEGIGPCLTIVQAGLFVSSRIEAFPAPELGLHRDLARALAAAGYGLVVELPRAVPLNKGRSGVSASSARAVDESITRAFERFILEDALFDRELLRAVDHRLAGILDRLVQGALGGEPPPLLPELPSVDASAPTVRAEREATPTPPPTLTPTVAAPEQVVRFAAALLETRAFEILVYDSRLRETRHRITLREVLGAHRGGVLRRMGDPVAPGILYLDPRDPLADALIRRLALSPIVTVVATETLPPASGPRRSPMQRLSRAALVSVAGHVHGVSALSAALAAIERIDGAIAQSSGLAPSPISVHQDLYGPDEMAHTDGTGISVNFASPRVRGLLSAMLTTDDVTAFGAVVDLIVHEKTHVSLASYVPKATAEHGASFYRRKDLLRRQLLEAMERGAIIDPIRWLPSIRRTLASAALPDPFELANAVGSPEAA